MQIKAIIGTVLAMVVVGFHPLAQARFASHPFPPFRIADNLYYVGDDFQADYLVVTPRGNILINSGYPQDLANIKASIKQLGFAYTATKIFLISQAHADHVGGAARIKQETGAQYMVMDADVPVVESGGKKDFQYGNSRDADDFYPAVKVDRVLHDGSRVQLGDTVIIAHHTGGHTKGCTTWTLQAYDKGQSYNVVIEGGPYVNPGYQLINNSAYPRIAADFQQMFKTLRALPCNIFLGAHGKYFDLEKKYARMLQDPTQNAFIDPLGHQQFVAEAELAFARELAKQQQAASK